MKDRAFWGYIVTQFCGAFNDNLFKQLMLLLAIPTAVAVVADQPNVAPPKEGDLQGLATVIFGLPFVIFGGLAGWLADRTSKRTVMIACKVAEIFIMTLGLLAFLAVPRLGMAGLWIVLFLMGIHSTFFGPGKYGILPEMISGKDLAKANGLVGMTTFLAIIFGTALGGILKDLLAPSDAAHPGVTAASGLWRASFVCIGVAVFGTLTSLLLRKTKVADPNVPLNADALFIPSATRSLLGTDKPLVGALFASCAFWFLAGLALQSVNALGKSQLGLSDTRTSLLTSIISIGIAAGAVIAGMISRGGADPRLVRIGNWGVLACCAMLAVTIPGKGHLLGFWGSIPMLILLGAAAAFFAIPVQVFIQSRPPQDMKGRTIAFMNQANFLAIVLAGASYLLIDWLLRTMEWPRSAAFAIMAIVYLPVALLYHLPEPAAEQPS